MNPELFVYLTLALFGLAIGSFLNVCIHRIPRRESLMYPPSRCPSCGTGLRWFDNVPVLGYLRLRGQCRTCRTPISPRYPIVELATMGVFLLHGLAFEPGPLLIVRLVFACVLIVLFAIDFEHHLLPNVITLPGIPAGLLASLFLPPGAIASLIGILVGGGSLWLIGEAYYRYAGQEGMGGGDVKMLAMIGAFLGWQQVILTLVLSSVAGSIIGGMLIATRRRDLKYELPYGTFLALAALVASLAGERIVAWYAGFYA
jgi:leader peptidase (prepilin peptidase) / N-methyltransferase